jgi:hypothetical protein
MLIPSARHLVTAAAGQPGPADTVQPDRHPDSCQAAERISHDDRWLSTGLMW